MTRIEPTMNGRWVAECDACGWHGKARHGKHNAEHDAARHVLLCEQSDLMADLKARLRPPNWGTPRLRHGDR